MGRGWDLRPTGTTSTRSTISASSSGSRSACWLAALEPRLGRDRALAAMLERYLEHQAAGQPVRTWPVAAPG